MESLGRDLKGRAGGSGGGNSSNEVHAEHSSSNTECFPLPQL